MVSTSTSLDLSGTSRSNSLKMLSIESSQLLIGPQESADLDVDSEDIDEDLQSSQRWYRQRENYNLKGKQKFIETTLGIHFQSPNNYKSFLKYTLDDHGQLYFWFMLIVSLAAIYNFITIPMRVAYANTSLSHDMPVSNTNPILLEDSLSFYVLDILADVIYLADIFCCQSRLQFVSKADGYRVGDFKESLKRYLKTFAFWIDVISIVFPFIDFVKYFIEFDQHYFRLLRLLKIWRVLQFGSLIERKFSFAQQFRQFKSLLQVVLLSNLTGSAFYLFYRFQGNESNGIFRNFAVIEREFETHPILFSFYWGFVMITNIHNQGRPSNSGQYLFMIIIHFVAALNMAYLYAVFVSSLRIKNWQRNQFLVKTQRAKQIFQISKLPSDDPSLDKAEDYFKYGYDNRIDVLEKTILTYFPKKLGLNVYKESYYAILKQPEIFKKMSQSFFHYLIPRMENHYFLPGEYIYQYYDVAKEMFIITKGGVTILEQLGSRDQIFPTEIRKGESFGFKELFADEDERRRTGDAITLGFVHCLVILRRDLDIITKTYLSEDDREQMKINMETVKSKFLQDKLKHARNRKWSEVDTLNVDEHIQTSLIQALKKIQVLLKLRDHMQQYVSVELSESDEEVGDLKDSQPNELIPKCILPPQMQIQRSIHKRDMTRTHTLTSISEFAIENSGPEEPTAYHPMRKYLERQDMFSDSEV